MRFFLPTLLSFVLICNVATAAQRKQARTAPEDVMAQCQKEAASKQIMMDKLQAYLKQCVARKSIDAGLVEQPK